MKNIALLLLVFFISTCHAQKEPKFNLNFEQVTSPEKLPNGWFKWGYYTLNTDTLSHSGKYSAKITSPESGNQFGSISYRIPANYTGEKITLKGFMKIRNVQNGFAGLLLRVDGNGNTLAFDNMQKEGIQGTRDWEKYSITLDYPEDAENIFVAGIITGSGEAWFDDFVLTIDDQDVQTKEEKEMPKYKADEDREFDNGSNISISRLDEQTLTNLELLGRVWGFMKYHHPEIAQGNYNWDYELFRILDKYISVENINERDELLIAWLNRLDKPAKCTTCPETGSDSKLKPDLLWIQQGIQNEDLKDLLHDIYKNRHQGKQYHVKLTPGVGNPVFLNENPYNKMPYPDDGFRLLSLYRYWNMIQYYFPYKHLTNKKWDDVLKGYIKKFIEAENELEYELAAIQLIGEVNDTHANLWGGGDKIQEWKGNFYAPVHLRYIENKFVVTDYYNPELKTEAGLEIGDVITHINGKSIETVIDEMSPYYPASNKPARYRNISADLLRSEKEQKDITFSRNSVSKKTSLKLYPRDSLDIYRWYRTDENRCYKMLDNNIGYITLANIKTEDIEPIKKEFKECKGIVIDIRNYPSTFVPFSLGGYFLSSPAPFVKFTAVNLDNPGEFRFTDNIEIPPTGDNYQGKLVVLVNELTQSSAEYTSMAFRASENTTIIGSTTAGADGNVSTIFLPGGLRTMISGIGVYYPDGEETQRVGIVPDLEIHPTIEGIKNGRDELLEKAIEVILSE